MDDDDDDDGDDDEMMMAMMAETKATIYVALQHRSSHLVQTNPESTIKQRKEWQIWCPMPLLVGCLSSMWSCSLKF